MPTDLTLNNDPLIPEFHAISVLIDQQTFEKLADLAKRLEAFLCEHHRKPTALRGF